MKYYAFNQNNSGGTFTLDIDSGIGHLVFIQAPDHEKTNIKARQIGIYFDGCESGQDCDCCGDRWDRADERNGTDEIPQVNRSPYRDMVFVHSVNGQFFQVKLA